MRIISHPMRLDGSGAVVCIDDSSDRAACELAGHVVSTLAGERPLAPAYGLTEVDPVLVAGVVALCEPEIDVISATVAPSEPGRVQIRMDVGWSEA